MTSSNSKGISSLRSLALEALGMPHPGTERLSVEVENLRRELDTINASAGFRLVQAYWSLREAVLPPGTRRGALYQVVKKATVSAVPTLRRSKLRPRSSRLDEPAARLPQPFDEALTSVSKLVTRPHVVIIAELSISSCRTYRVDHKVKMFEALGYDVSVTSWTDFVASRQAIQFSTLAIFYRVPATGPVKALIAEAQRLGLPTYFDIDDLVFDVEAYAALLSDLSISEALKVSLLEGAELYRAALALCGAGMASTPTIAEAMRNVVSGDVFVLPNGLDPRLLEIREATRALPAPRKRSDVVVIGYGSGTETHDEDFRAIAPALLRVLRRRPQVQLALHGKLKIDERFGKYGDRIFRVPFLDARDYYRALATFDISVAPLIAQQFNDAKSNIKFLEAGIFGVPTVASPSEPFRATIVDGKNGRLARTEQEWFDALIELIDDPVKRVAMGQAAAKTAEAYDLKRISSGYLQPILPRPQRVARKKQQPRVLIVNVLFSPMTFGGATVIAEQLAVRLVHLGCEVAVVTGVTATGQAPASVARYEALGVPVYGIELPRGDDPSLNFKNEAIGVAFADILASVQPDVVHFHSIQQLGASMLDVCAAAGIPSVVTLHDAWWLCQRQFMMRPSNVFCGQHAIDLRTCSKCVPDSALLYRRDRELRQSLSQAELLLTPSDYQASLYRANGFADARIRVNRNGVLVPTRVAARKRSGPVRFAYLGGKAHHKGWYWLLEVFKALRQTNYHLKVVDIHRKFGTPGFEPADAPLAGKVQFVEPFSPDELDAFYEDVDVLLSPSLGPESFGMAVREALARNVWVIATEGGALHEDIVRGVNGDVVPMGDSLALTAAVTRILEGETRLDGYANPHRGDVRDLDAQAGELLGYLREAVASGARARADET